MPLHRLIGSKMLEVVMDYKYSEQCEKIVTNKLEQNVLKRLSPRRGTVLTELVDEVAMDYDVDCRTVRRRVQSLIDKGMVYVANPNQKPYMIFATEYSEPSSSRGTPAMTIEEALFVMFAKEYGQKVMPASSFQKLSDSGFFKSAERVMLNAKRAQPNQKEFRLESFAINSCLLQLYTNPSIDISVVEAIKNAIYEDLELELHLSNYLESVYVKPLEIQLLNGKQFLKVKQLTHPRSLKYIDIEDAFEAHVVDYWPLHSQAQMRRTA